MTNLNVDFFVKGIFSLLTVCVHTKKPWFSEQEHIVVDGNSFPLVLNLSSCQGKGWRTHTYNYYLVSVCILNSVLNFKWIFWFLNNLLHASSSLPLFPSNVFSLRNEFSLNLGVNTCSKYRMENVIILIVYSPILWLFKLMDWYYQHFPEYALLLGKQPELLFSYLHLHSCNLLDQGNQILWHIPNTWLWNHLPMSLGI